MRSFAMLLPCGISLFSGVEFVCCPKHFKGKYLLLPHKKLFIYWHLLSTAQRVMCTRNNVKWIYHLISHIVKTWISCKNKINFLGNIHLFIWHFFNLFSNHIEVMKTNSFEQSFFLIRLVFFAYKFFISEHKSIWKRFHSSSSSFSHSFHSINYRINFSPQHTCVSVCVCECEIYAALNIINCCIHSCRWHCGRKFCMSTSLFGPKWFCEIDKHTQMTSCQCTRSRNFFSFVVVWCAAWNMSLEMKNFMQLSIWRNFEFNFRP
jgi:hypothetical protein